MLVDLAEFNPKYDINDIGKKSVARLVYDIVDLIDKNIKTSLPVNYIDF
jgi:formiminoglutamase